MGSGQSSRGHGKSDIPVPFRTAHSPLNKPIIVNFISPTLLIFFLTSNKVERFDEKITEISREAKYNEIVSRLACFKGISRQVAMRVVTEVGDFGRFSTAGEFASYIGLTPSEHSSGNSEVKGSITKMGNGHVRKTLIEASQSAIRGVPGRKGKQLKARQSGNDPKVIHYADKGNMRFGTKFKKMMEREKNRNTAVTAVAREMACFIWGMAAMHIEDRPKFNPETGEILG